MFQCHPAYREQVGLLTALPGTTVRPVIPDDVIEHERWRHCGGSISRLFNRQMLRRRVRLGLSDKVLHYLCGHVPPYIYRNLGSARAHIDADDPLSLLPRGTRNAIPGREYRAYALQLLSAVRRGFLTLSFWTNVQLLGFLANLYAEETGDLLRQGRISVLPPAIAPRIDSVRPCPGGPLRCLTIASGKFWHKGVADAITAVHLAVAQGLAEVTLTVLAEQVPASWQRYLAEYPGIFRVVSRISRPQLDELYRQHDLMLFLSHHDTFGWVVLEAKAYGMATLSTDFYSRPELIRHGLDGLLVSDPFASPFLPVDPISYAESHIHVSGPVKPFISPALTPYLQGVRDALCSLASERQRLAEMGQEALQETMPGGRFSVGSRLQRLKMILED